MTIHVKQSVYVLSEGINTLGLCVKVTAA